METGMADQGIWFKLHCSSLDDPSLDNLSLEDWARWAKLGAYLKRHGTVGVVHLRPPSAVLCAAFKVPDFELLLVCISRLPNVCLRRDGDDNASGIVSMLNWRKYQIDTTSYLRLKKWRQSKDDNDSRGEEKRREEKRSKTTMQIAAKNGGKWGGSYQEFGDWVFTEYMSLKPGDSDPKEKEAVSAAYRRYGRALRDIMAFARGDTRTAQLGLQAIGRRMEAMGLVWGLEAVARWFPDWSSDKEAFDNETKKTRRT